MIIGIKTIVGETIIGEQIESLESSEVIQIEEPLNVIISPTGNGTFGVGLAPYIPFTDEKKFSFMREHYMHTFVPSDDLINEYNRVTGRGIVRPSNKIEVVT